MKLPYVHRRTGSRDSNHKEIVAGLEAAGRSVLELWDLPPGNRHRKGAPDILVGWAGSHNLLMEIKREKGGKLTEEQTTWHCWWRGQKVVVVRTLSEALAATGITMHSPVDRVAVAESRSKGVLNGNGKASRSKPKGTRQGDAGQGDDNGRGGGETRLRLVDDDPLLDKDQTA